ncbi:MAG: O-antigen ligase family protein [Lachnospiraceae bacterium]|nr:O-antigen ligase family protein [Lachnospiraceae bacterium]
MKLIYVESKQQKKINVKAYLSAFEQYIVFAYLFCMLGIFPLYYKEKFYGIGTAKFEFFWQISLYFIGISLVFAVIKIFLQKVTQNAFYKKKIDNNFKIKEKEEPNVLLKCLDNLSSLDYAVFIYTICVLLSYVFSNFKEFAWKGAAGWNMGLCSQMIFVALYFILSRQRELFAKMQTYKGANRYQDLALLILIVHLIASALAFLLGILHRFEIDPLGMYEGLELYQKIEFLSTIGQATWFSGYICTVFAVGVILFYVGEKKWLQLVTGIYSILSFGILVTQNSDSAFFAVVGMMLLLGYFSLADVKKCYRFWQVMSLMWGSFVGIGLLQRVFVDRAIPLDRLSVFLSQSIVTIGIFMFSMAVMLFYGKCYKREIAEKDRKEGNIEETKIHTDKIMSVSKRIYQIGLILLLAAVVMIVIFIYLNTKGYLLQWFNYQSSNSYLLFDSRWGNGRGSTWMICLQSFLDMPFYQKLFGIGPDSLSAYLYSMPDIEEVLRSLWGSQRLTNAHNEYLNSLLCYGIVGVTAWLTVLIGGIRYFYNKAKDNPFMIAFALCIMGYACHNIFCYQQVCCTPFLFIALGIGESLTKSENFNTIK